MQKEGILKFSKKYSFLIKGPCDFWKTKTLMRVCPFSKNENK